MPRSHDVSVIIPTVGRPALANALASAQAQTMQPKEIIVVFDGPSEKQAEVQAIQDLPLIKVIMTDGGAGAAAARNIGMRSASGSYVAFLDDDDTWLPFHLETTVRHL